MSDQAQPGVLFIDDEIRVLDGLRRSLFQLRRDWRIFFASSGAEGLALLDREEFQAVVCDLKMPGMSGLEVLGRVREARPDCFRLVLSGQCDPGMELATWEVAHRYLAKPCSRQALESTLKGLRQLPSLVPGRRYRCRLIGLNHLPSADREISRLLDGPAVAPTSVAAMVHLVGKCPGLAARVLQVANSGLPDDARNCYTPVRGGMGLGHERLWGLLQTMLAQARTDPPGWSDPRQEELRRHGLVAARLAAQIAGDLGGDVRAMESAYTAGLLHDVGRALQVAERPEFRPVDQDGYWEGDTEILEAERAAFSADHAAAGAFVLGLWGLPDLVVDAVRLHHGGRFRPRDNSASLTAVQLAEALIADEPECSAARAILDQAREMFPDHRLELWMAMASRVKGQDVGG